MNDEGIGASLKPTGVVCNDKVVTARFQAAAGMTCRATDDTVATRNYPSQPCYAPQGGQTRHRRPLPLPEVAASAVSHRFWPAAQLRGPASAAAGRRSWARLCLWDPVRSGSVSPTMLPPQVWKRGHRA